MDRPIQRREAAALARLEDIAAKARGFVAQAKAQNTLRAYRADWRDFTEWCAAQSLDALPTRPETVALYLTHLVHAGRRAATLQRRLSAISQAHQAAGFETPTRDARVRAVWAGIRRSIGMAQEGKAPVRLADLRSMLAATPEGLLGLRDRALLLVGFAGAFRRSELVGLDVEDVEWRPEGMAVTIRRSKTDPEGHGRRVGIPLGRNGPATCPVRALRAWLDAAGIEGGPIFRRVNRHGQVLAKRLTSQSIALVVKRYAEAAGLDPARLAGHSLRAGLATEAAAQGASERSIMNQTGHRSVAMARRYIREGSLFLDNAAEKTGL
ncbi:MAG: site-specific integrase [Candidatus Sumerlaeota bacterium]|nr:site-specific integrase [Candidatus Sumerlaeota bacterium]